MDIQEIKRKINYWQHMLNWYSKGAGARRRHTKELKYWQALLERESLVKDGE